MEIERKEFRTIKVPVQNIYLTEEEIQSLFALDLTDLEEEARDLFIIGCDTAQPEWHDTRISCVWVWRNH